jgi:hypothetical protein
VEGILQRDVEVVGRFRGRGQGGRNGDDRSTGRKILTRWGRALGRSHRSQSGPSPKLMQKLAEHHVVGANI